MLGQFVVFYTAVEVIRVLFYNPDGLVDEVPHCTIHQG